MAKIVPTCKKCGEQHWPYQVKLCSVHPKYEPPEDDGVDTRARDAEVDRRLKKRHPYAAMYARDGYRDRYANEVR